MGICAHWADIYLHNYKLEELGMLSLKTINILMTTGKITKTGNLAATFHKPVGEANTYIRFGYVPLAIF